MIAIIEKKIRNLQAEAAAAMMANTVDALVAAGRFAACDMLLGGDTPASMRDGIDVLPLSWPQRRGWLEIIQTFDGLIEESESTGMTP